ncbi:glycosyltransferase family 2 protein [Pedobacter agri]|uniref:Glycosyltransferase family 2 protein n=1 Tax=Pedobacter agri TaxID=454586 RepID=A0A9X3DBW6_9SPHI|nr:glycosyltransferase family 2 protein [Pedobacter agri]MCX3264878.1 glycosyltransferase family 2 protein [Pedobacter agri]
MQPLVSIIIPSYNSAGFISATLDSVLSQGYENWELTVIDDCSSDETCAVVSAYASMDTRISLIALSENQGVSNARNTGLENSWGKYVAFLDSDDIWLEDKLKSQVQFMENSQSALSFCAYQRIDENGNIISRIVPVPQRVDYNKLLAHNVVIFSTSMILRTAIGKLRFSRAGHEDWIFLLKLLKNCGAGHGINLPLALYRVRKNSVSSNKIKAIGYTWRIFRVSEGLNFFRSAVLLARYAVSASLKRLQ